MNENFNTINDFIEHREKSDFHITLEQFLSLFYYSPEIYFVNKNRKVIYNSFDKIKNYNVLCVEPDKYFETYSIILDTEDE